MTDPEVFRTIEHNNFLIIRINWLTDDILQFYANGMKSLMLDTYIKWLRIKNDPDRTMTQRSDADFLDEFDTRKNRVAYCSID